MEATKYRQVLRNRKYNLQQKPENRSIRNQEETRSKLHSGRLSYALLDGL